jgi:hypothetical protein
LFFPQNVFAGELFTVTLISILALAIIRIRDMKHLIKEGNERQYYNRQKKGLQAGD